MDSSVLILSLVVSYLIGSISISRLAYRILAPGKEMHDREIPVPGSNETFTITATGASSASMELGSRAGCVIGLLDMLKAALPTLAFKLLFPSQPYFLVAALAEMAGHNWPVFHRFKGGRGVSSVYGSLLVIDAIGAFAVAFGGMVLGLVIIKDFIVAYLGGLWLLIPWLWWRTGDPAYVAYAIGANILFVLGMIPDLKQYMRFKGQGKADLRTVANTTPMGRGMMKMMEMLHLVRKED